MLHSITSGLIIGSNEEAKNQKAFAASATSSGIKGGYSRYSANEYELRWFQKKAVLELIKSLSIKRNTLLTQPTGSGKTVMALAAIANYTRSSKGSNSIHIIASPTQLIKNRWGQYANSGISIKGFGKIDAGQFFMIDSGKEFESFLREPPSGRGANILIVSHDLIRKYPWAIAQFNQQYPYRENFVWVDEVHWVNSDEDEPNVNGQSISSLVRKKIPVIGMTATPYRYDNKLMFNDDVYVISRSLLEHRMDLDETGRAYCPDIRIESVFPVNIGNDEMYNVIFHIMTMHKLTGDLRKLIAAYGYHYIGQWAKSGNNFRHTLMMLPGNIGPRTYKAVGDALVHAISEVTGAFDEYSLINMASLDGRRLFSESGTFAKNETFERINDATTKIILSIRMASEGMDWVNADSVYMPNIPSSFAAFGQRIGRTMRQKPPLHPFADESLVVHFPLGIDTEKLTPEANEKLSKEHTSFYLRARLFARGGNHYNTEKNGKRVSSGVNYAQANEQYKEQKEKAVSNREFFNICQEHFTNGNKEEAINRFSKFASAVCNTAIPKSDIEYAFVNNSFEDIGGLMFPFRFQTDVEKIFPKKSIPFERVAKEDLSRIEKKINAFDPTMFDMLKRNTSVALGESFSIFSNDLLTKIAAIQYHNDKELGRIVWNVEMPLMIAEFYRDYGRLPVKNSKNSGKENTYATYLSRFRTSLLGGKSYYKMFGFERDLIDLLITRDYLPTNVLDSKYTRKKERGNG